MAYDIYGQSLERGHCEVHPWVPYEYPCPECMERQEREEHERQMELEYYTEIENAYLAEVEEYSQLDCLCRILWYGV